VRAIINVDQMLASKDCATVILQMEQNAIVTVNVQVNFAISTNVLPIMISLPFRNLFSKYSKLT
jgi:hypothetical protein